MHFPSFGQRREAIKLPSARMCGGSFQESRFVFSHIFIFFTPACRRRWSRCLEEKLGGHIPKTPHDHSPRAGDYVCVCTTYVSLEGGVRVCLHELVSLVFPVLARKFSFLSVRRRRCHVGRLDGCLLTSVRTVYDSVASTLKEKYDSSSLFFVSFTRASGAGFYT